MILLFYAGDWVSEHVVELVEQIAPCESVAGNNDGSDIIERFGLRKILTLGDCRIGLIHGDGYRKTTRRPRSVPGRRAGYRHLRTFPCSIQQTINGILHV